MGTLSRTVSYGANEQMTNTKLHNLMDTATAGNFGVSDIATTSGTLITKSATAPASPYANQMWFDTSNDILMQYETSLSAFIPIPWATRMENESAMTISANALVVVGTSVSANNMFNTSATASAGAPLGVVSETVSPGDFTLVFHGGRTNVIISETVTAGDHIAYSLTEGYAKPADFAKEFRTPGVFLSNSTSGMAECVLFG